MVILIKSWITEKSEGRKQLLHPGEHCGKEELINANLNRVIFRDLKAHFCVQSIFLMHLNFSFGGQNEDSSKHFKATCQQCTTSATSKMKGVAPS